MSQSRASSHAHRLAQLKRLFHNRAPQRVQDGLRPSGRPSNSSLSPGIRADLERLAEYHGTGLARRAQIILERAEGRPALVVARHVGVHPDTVRRWQARFEQRGLAGLRHGNLGQSRNLVFDARTRAEIRRRADSDPTALGESYATWSLLKLRAHLINNGVVRTISHEAIRQVLRQSPSPRRYWRN